ncbi:RNA polymerase sigma factor [Nannocystis punicea]|uniref:Sigma-70 family RNA polymerase sigma factor n=1 Tax=Nannocystis punicea TaxID=2995304 RepID=A0ABY7GVS4_9BACT|nr:sigma-70 family RNA polymerase sigma factor [Nannocystis poenicansa]WAS90995.1 sigma-70 family RNA polymerase sigma factor [Nannocystis poenicansa]
MSDEALLEAWNGGDAAAGERLFDRHFERLVRFFRTKVHGEVEELVQQTFLGCLESRGRFRGEGQFQAFLFAIARNVLFNFYRERQRGGAAVAISEVSLHDLDPRPSAVIAERREHQILLECLRRIPLDAQLVLELHYWEDMTSAAIADVLQVPHGTAQTRIRRARQLLAAEVERQAGSLGQATLDFETWARSLRALVDRDR